MSRRASVLSGLFTTPPTSERTRPTPAHRVSHWPKYSCQRHFTHKSGCIAWPARLHWDQPVPPNPCLPTPPANLVSHRPNYPHQRLPARKGNGIAVRAGPHSDQPATPDRPPNTRANCPCPHGSSFSQMLLPKAPLPQWRLHRGAFRDSLRSTPNTNRNHPPPLLGTDGFSLAQILPPNAPQFPCFSWAQLPPPKATRPTRRLHHLARKALF